MKNNGGCVQFDSMIWENVQQSTGLSIPLIIIISWICSIIFLWSKVCFSYFYQTLEKSYWLFKVYLLEFDIEHHGKIWIQQGRQESKKFGQLWVRLYSTDDGERGLSSEV
jgi:hypothetical protein